MKTLSTVKLHSGAAMPALGLGTWHMKGDVAASVQFALDCGYRMIDTSSDYGSQPGIGEALASTKIPREDLYIVTKIEENDDAYERVLQNLKELQLNYADLMLIHRPPRTGVGEKLWAGLIRAQQEGKVRDIGVSNYSVGQIQVLANSSGVMPAVNQIEWSPFGWSRDMLEFCYQNNIVIQAYSPLTRAERLTNNILREIGDTYGKTPTQILIRWNIQKGVVPLPKSDNQQHIQENLDVFDFELSAHHMDQLDKLNDDYSALADKPVYQSM